MPTESGDEFKVIAASTTITAAAQSEQEQLTRGASEPPPNSVTLSFGKFCHIKWHAESGAPLFCFISIVVLLIFSLLIGGLSVLNSSMQWPGEVFKFIGQAILTLVGAVVGASVTGGSGIRVRRNVKN